MLNSISIVVFFLQPSLQKIITKAKIKSIRKEYVFSLGELQLTDFSEKAGPVSLLRDSGIVVLRVLIHTKENCTKNFTFHTGNQ